MIRNRVLAAIASLLVLCTLLSACSDVRRYGGTGVVEDVRPEYGQVIVAHEEIRGLMGAMTMNFDVPDAELLAKMSAGQEISFTLVFTGEAYQIVDATVTGEVSTDGEWARLGEKLVRTTEAPDFADFELVDQEGVARGFADYAGKALLVDFIFTTCPGPCPILTAKHVALQRSLAPELRERIHFVSISLDPETDTPAEMRAYAEKHGVDLAHWSFLTAPPGRAELGEKAIRAYAVGKTRNDSGEIEHLIAAFLVDERGRILQRYLGMDTHPAEKMRAELEALARSTAQPEAS